MKKPSKTTKAAKPTLPAAEWAFHRVGKDQWEALTNYEYQREAAAFVNTVGSAPDEARRFWRFWLAAAGLPPATNPKKQKPWSQLPATVRCFLLTKSETFRRHKSDGALQPLTEIKKEKSAQAPSTFSERVTFDIDWRARDAALIKQFAAWLAAGRKQKRGFFSDLKPENKTGPKDSAPALCDLVIWRARRAGLSMNATAELVQQFLQAAFGMGKVYNPVQRARACANAQKKIEAFARSRVWMFNNLPKYRPVEDWIALAQGEQLPPIIERLKQKGAGLNKVPKPNRGK